MCMSVLYFLEVLEDCIKGVSITGIRRYIGQKFRIYFFSDVYCDVKPVKLLLKLTS